MDTLVYTHKSMRGALRGKLSSYFKSDMFEETNLDNFDTNGLIFQEYGDSRYVFYIHKMEKRYNELFEILSVDQVLDYVVLVRTTSRLKKLRAAHPNLLVSKLDVKYNKNVELPLRGIQQAVKDRMLNAVDNIDIARPDFLEKLRVSDLPCKRAILDLVDTTGYVHSSREYEYIEDAYLKKRVNKSEVCDLLALYTYRDIYKFDMVANEYTRRLNTDLYSQKIEKVVIKEIDYDKYKLRIVTSASSIARAQEWCRRYYPEYFVEIELTIAPVLAELLLGLERIKL